ncbi:MAG: hypothetical protein FWG52_08380 [Proteobacteria bacterium]|jgi:recombinational DNA repair ATPase RecF|nr:hypothetical protein [Pseudomonadota bacterium]
MLRLNNRVRFTNAETDKMLTIGIDLCGVRTQSGINAEFARWANALAQRRPDLLEKIARELTKAVQRLEKPEAALDSKELKPSW